MPNRDYNSQVPYWYPIKGKFIVRNVSKERNKTISIFNYPIKKGETRDLLRIPEIGEEEIRVSLLKGTLRNKLIAEEIEIVESDINLIQFNEEQKAFLRAGGVRKGLEIGPEQLTEDVADIIGDGSASTLTNRREQVTLIGAVNDSNTIYKIPFDARSGTNTFLVDQDHMIQVYLNGVRQYYLDDYIIAESGGIGTGYDTIITSFAPETEPAPSDILTADYWIPR